MSPATCTKPAHQNHLNQDGRDPAVLVCSPPPLPPLPTMQVHLQVLQHTAGQPKGGAGNQRYLIYANTGPAQKCLATKFWQYRIKRSRWWWHQRVQILDIIFIQQKMFPRVFEELSSQIVDSQFKGCYPFRSEYPPLEVSGIVQQRLCPPSVTLLHFTRDQDQDNSQNAVGNIF